jgi:hypothetical protein
MVMPLLEVYSQFQLALESWIVEGGNEESVEGGRDNCNVDILRLVCTAESGERGTANEGEAVAETLREEGRCSVESFKQCGLLARSDVRRFEDWS